MRLKITKPLYGSIDGRHLGRFAVGGVYEVGTSLANYLLAIRAAEPVTEAPAADPVSPGHGELLDELQRRLRGWPSDRPAKAADGPDRPRKKR